MSQKIEAGYAAIAELSELLANLLATVRNLPPGPERQAALRRNISDAAGYARGKDVNSPLAGTMAPQRALIFCHHAAVAAKQEQDGAGAFLPGARGSRSWHKPVVQHRAGGILNQSAALRNYAESWLAIQSASEGSRCGG